MISSDAFDSKALKPKLHNTLRVGRGAFCAGAPKGPVTWSMTACLFGMNSFAAELGVSYV